MSGDGDQILGAGALLTLNITGRATALLGRHLGKDKPGARIGIRDIRSMIAKYRTVRGRCRKLRKANRALKARIWRLENPVSTRPVRQPSQEEKQKSPLQRHGGTVIPFPQVNDEPGESISQAVLTELGRKATADSPAGDEVGRLVRVFLDAKVSLRGFSRMLRSLQEHKLYAGVFLPCPTTMANWLMRAGLAKLKGVVPSEEPCIDIIDHWIGSGNVKLFVVMRLAHSKATCLSEGKAPRLRDFEVIHLELSTSSTGELVKDSLEKLYARVGAPLAVISDRGSDLCKGLELLNANRDKQIVHIQDISHRIACIVKKQYGDLCWFQHLLKNLAHGHKKLTNSEFAYLRSPKLNIKARFLNISRAVNWAISFLDRMNNPSIDHREKRKLREAYGSLKAHEKRMLPHLKKTLDITNTLMRILKINGLTPATCAEVRGTLSNLGPNNKVRLAIEHWLSGHEAIRESLKLAGWTAPLPISSDPVETLFSAFKILEARAPQGDPTRLVLVLPLLAGETTAESLSQLVRGKSHSQACEWVKEHVPESIHSKRRKLSGMERQAKATKKRHAPENRPRPCVRAVAA